MLLDAPRSCRRHELGLRTGRVIDLGGGEQAVQVGGVLLSHTSGQYDVGGVGVGGVAWYSPWHVKVCGRCSGTFGHRARARKSIGTVRMHAAPAASTYSRDSGACVLSTILHQK